MFVGNDLAVKWSTNRFHPNKVIVLESITNTEQKFAAAAQLGARLSRLFENKENCILGITSMRRIPTL